MGFALTGAAVASSAPGSELLEAAGLSIMVRSQSVRSGWSHVSVAGGSGWSQAAGELVAAAWRHACAAGM